MLTIINLFLLTQAEESHVFNENETFVVSLVQLLDKGMLLSLLIKRKSSGSRQSHYLFYFASEIESSCAVCVVFEN